MKALKILGVVFGALLLLAGGALLAGSALVTQGQGAFDQELAKSGLAGPVSGTVLSIDQGAIYTVSYVDQQGQPKTGAGPIASGTDAPEVGETVSVFYNTNDPGQIVILNIPGGGIAGIADKLRTAGIVCLIVGGILLIAGIIGLLTGRKPAAVTGSPAGYPPGQPGVQPPPAGYPQQQPPPGYAQQPAAGVSAAATPSGVPAAAAGLPAAAAAVGVSAAAAPTRISAAAAATAARLPAAAVTLGLLSISALQPATLRPFRQPAADAKVRRLLPIRRGPVAAA